MTGAQPSKTRTPRRADSAERAYLVIRKLAVDFRLKPDERINEVQLAKQLKVSRTPIREALNRLASEGFLVFQPNRGFFFRAPDMDDLLKLFELRAIVEAGSFTLACLRASDADIDGLDAFWIAALERYEHYDPDEILMLDEEFHVRLARLAGNDEINRALSGLNARIRFARRIQIGHGRHSKRMTPEHTKVIAALKGRQAELGAAILKSHISLSVEDAADVLKEAVFKLFIAPGAPGRRSDAPDVSYDVG